MNKHDGDLGLPTTLPLLSPSPAGAGAPSPRASAAPRAPRVAPRSRSADWSGASIAPPPPLLRVETAPPSCRLTLAASP